MLVPLGVIVAGAALWAVSLGPISARAVTANGLQTAFGPAWFIALAIFASGAVAELARARPRAAVVVVLVVGVVVVLYATVPAISHAPQYTWSYKHIGVTRSIMEHRTPFGTGDIYHRWPGLFSAAAWFSALTHTTPLYFSAWFEFAFMLFDVALVAAIAHSTFGNPRITGFSALVFSVLNWIGQDYYSPQGLGYALNLTLMLVVVSAFPLARAPASRLMRALARLVRSPIGADSATEPAAPPPGWSTPGAALAVVVLDAAATATHQLTPFMVLVQLGALTLLGLRPRWLVLITAALAIGYTVPQLSFLARDYGIFKGLNPIDNVQQATGAQVHPGWLEAHAGQLLTLCGMALAVAGLAALRRRGETRLALRLAALVVAPFFLLFANSYGGEGGLRVVLFAAPWMSLLAGSFLAGLRRPLRLGVGAVATAGMLALFLFAFAAYRTGNVIPSSEVAASEHYYAHAPRGSVMVLAGQDFPTNQAPNYSEFRGSLGDSTPDLLDDARFRRPSLGRRDLPALIAFIEGFAKRHRGGWANHGYLVFSTTQMKYTSYFRVLAPTALPGLERAVATSPRFRLWYATGSARIYRLLISPRHRRSLPHRGSARHPRSVPHRRSHRR